MAAVTKNTHYLAPGIVNFHKHSKGMMMSQLEQTDLSGRKLHNYFSKQLIISIHDRVESFSVALCWPNVQGQRGKSEKDGQMVQP